MNAFGQKNFKFHAWVQKCHFGNFSILFAKMALLNPSMKYKSYFGQKTSFEGLWKCHILKISITCPRVRQIQDLGKSKYKLRIFSKRTHNISKILFNLGSYEYLASLESKIRRCPFLLVFIIVKNQCGAGICNNGFVLFFRLYKRLKILVITKKKLTVSLFLRTEKTTKIIVEHSIPLLRGHP